MTVLSEESVQNIYAGSETLSATLGVTNRGSSNQASQLVKSALVTLMLVGAAVAVVSIWLTYASDLDWHLSVFSMGAYLLSSALVLAHLKTHPHAYFGAANAITAIRAGISCLIAGALFETDWLLKSDMVLALLGAAAIALCLDGIDGYIARRTGTNSVFGARYDMEVDAALILCLSLFAFLFDKAGWWVIIIGGMRYMFVISQYFVTRLQGALSPSFRRQTICVLQIISLGIILLPLIQPPVSTVIAALSLATLSYSFGRDIAYLLRQSPVNVIEQRAR